MPTAGSVPTRGWQRHWTSGGPRPRPRSRPATLNLAQARVIAEALEALPKDLGEDLLAKAETLMVTEANQLGPRELRIFGSRLLEYLAPDIAEQADYQRRPTDPGPSPAQRTWFRDGRSPPSSTSGAPPTTPAGTPTTTPTAPPPSPDANSVVPVRHIGPDSPRCKRGPGCHTNRGVYASIRMTSQAGQRRIGKSLPRDGGQARLVCGTMEGVVLRVRLFSGDGMDVTVRGARRAARRGHRPDEAVTCRRMQATQLADVTSRCRRKRRWDPRPWRTTGLRRPMRCGDAPPDRRGLGPP